ncbi:DUF6922 domain-containing protein [Myroides marinus]|uniref:DUF6922 domain-containing protein n=1 Tax=Myroides marinus TaxID=703342 RepID=A0A1H6XBE6_9FLAO|nr:hypothetical protein [Myroides marinus]KUF44489.1 hypothetical protein AS361_15675 [Myroides marinus]MDM1371477.1 hypothetical protein [Myroides marinus]MDM1376577.1 hypothetical protein [Myroides marinus]MDM1379998.1 hypothetical protein [Myroides marinus]MDM1387269.1 hypothetical protein [Myroides marinus]
MNITSLNLAEMPRVFFWDVDIESLDLKRDYFFIISRILSFTTVEFLCNNIDIIRTQFDMQIIQQVLENTSEIISEDIYKLMSETYDIPNYSHCVNIPV